MAYWIHESGNKNNSLWRFYQCDYLSDIKLLPTVSKDGQPQPSDTVCLKKCAPGSQCFCQEDGSVWFLGKDTDKWVQRKGAYLSGGASEGTGSITEEDVEPIPPLLSNHYFHNSLCKLTSHSAREMFFYFTINYRKQFKEVI